MDKKDDVLLKLEQDFINEFKGVRKQNNLTQQKLANKSKIIRESIARIETHKVSPQISTIIKLLESIGYKLAIEKITEEE